MARQHLSKLERKEALDHYDPWRNASRQAGRSVDFSTTLPADFQIGHLGAEHIERFLNKGSINRTSKHTYYSACRTFFGWCNDVGIISDNPIEDVPKPRNPKKQADFLTPREVEHLVETTADELEFPTRSDEVAAAYAVDPEDLPTETRREMLQQIKELGG